MQLSPIENTRQRYLSYYLRWTGRFAEDFPRRTANPPVHRR